jgi:spore maturation protein SpmA
MLGFKLGHPRVIGARRLLPLWYGIARKIKRSCLLSIIQQCSQPFAPALLAEVAKIKSPEVFNYL